MRPKSERASPPAGTRPLYPIFAKTWNRLQVATSIASDRCGAAGLNPRVRGFRLILVARAFRFHPADAQSPEHRLSPVARPHRWPRSTLSIWKITLPIGWILRAFGFGARGANNIICCGNAGFLWKMWKWRDSEPCPAFCAAREPRLHRARSSGF